MNPAQTLTMLSPGSVVADRFSVDALVGAGGMGVVYKARDRVSGQLVALKVMGRVGAEGRARFEREAKAIAALSHPSIVKLVCTGQTADDSPFIAMEWVDGEDLSALLARGALSIDATLRVATQVADALACAHAAGLVHRDIKPSNLILSDADARVVKLVDFGLARSQDLSRDVTTTGSVLGTPGYMAPEQARGSVGAAPSADVFSLGAVLFECLTRRQAFPGDNPFEVLARLLLEEAPSVRRYAPDVPEPIERFVASLLEREPSRRPSDGASVRDLIARIDLASSLSAPCCSEARAVRTLNAPASLVWGMLVDTDRWDRLIGAPRSTYSFEIDPETQVRSRVGRASLLGIEMQWREVGEWIEGVSMWGERRFIDGPFDHIGIRATTAPVGDRDDDSAPIGEQCRVDFQAYVKARPGAPEGIEAMMAAQFQKKLGRYLDSLELLFGGLAPHEKSLDAGVMGDGATAAARRLLMRSGQSEMLVGKAVDRSAMHAAPLARLRDAPVSDLVKRELIPLLSNGSREALRGMRPYELARSWSLDRRDVLQGFLHANRAGVTQLRWLMKCPSCRVASGSTTSVSGLREHARCEVCQLDFGLDLARNVEVVFDAADASEDEIASPFYCASSPVFRPHVVALLRLEAMGVRREALRLPRGHIRVRAVMPRRGASPRTSSVDIVVDDHAPTLVLLDVTGGLISVRDRSELDVGVAFEDEALTRERALSTRRMGGELTLIELTTEGSDEVEITVERAVEVDPTSVGEELLSFGEFLDLLSEDRLASGVSLPVTRLCVAVLDIDGVEALCDRVGDAVGFDRWRDFRSSLLDAIRSSGASTPMILGGRLVCCLEPTTSRIDGFRAALHLVVNDPDLSLHGAIEVGSALLVQGAEHAEIFGAAVRAAALLASRAAMGEIELGPALSSYLTDKTNQPGSSSLSTEESRAA